MKIVKLPTTPIFSVIVNHLYELKKQGYSDSLLADAFNEIVDTWESSSKFVGSFDKDKDVTTFIMNQISQNKHVFFVLGIKTAGETVKKAIKDMDGILKKKGYATKITISEPQKVEVIIYIKT